MYADPMAPAGNASSSTERLTVPALGWNLARLDASAAGGSSSRTSSPSTLLIRTDLRWARDAGISPVCERKPYGATHLLLNGITPGPTDGPCRQEHSAPAVSSGARPRSDQRR